MLKEFVAQCNIDRFEAMLKMEEDLTEKILLRYLLAREREDLRLAKNEFLTNR